MIRSPLCVRARCGSVAASAFTIVPRHVLGRGQTAPSDKLNIAKAYLVPRQLDANGLTPRQAKFQDAALKRIIASIPTPE